MRKSEWISRTETERRPALCTLEGYGEIASSFRIKSREGAGFTHSAEVVTFRGGPDMPQVVHG